MTRFKVMLSAINDVKTFVDTVGKYDFEVDLISGRYAVDAKSIMGIFSLDLSKPIIVEAHTEDYVENGFLDDIKKYMIKEQ